MSTPRSRIVCVVMLVMPFVLAACRFDLPEPSPADAIAERSCGDGVHQPDRGESCDTGGDTQACDGDCTFPECGDGYLNPSFTPPGAVKTERCDTAGDSESCDADCTVRLCGDGYVSSAAGEQCDDGNGSNKDACPDGFNGTCKPAFCGDGHVRTLGPSPEECDDGPANSDDRRDACRTSCRKATCGDGVKDTGEQCDGGGCTPPKSCDHGCVCRL